MLGVSNGNCYDSLIKTIHISPAPTPSFVSKVLCHDSVRFVETSKITSGKIKSWSWDFGDNSTSAQGNPIHVYADSGYYVVKLLVTSDSLCKSERTDTIHVIKCSSELTTLVGEPMVPTGFTPNGDRSNDILFVKGGPFKTLDFRIFNEWGNQIFVSQIQSDGWDGTYKSAEQPVGKFIWTLSGELINGKAVKMAGEVILNR
jgi:gliding motility-associated-like protein